MASITIVPWIISREKVAVEVTSTISLIWFGSLFLERVSSATLSTSGTV